MILSIGLTIFTHTSVVGSPVGGEGVLAKPAAAKKPLPRLKVEANLTDIRVAIVEDVEDPQALTLRVGCP